jgi:hypothetical protein
VSGAVEPKARFRVEPVLDDSGALSAAIAPAASPRWLRSASLTEIAELLAAAVLHDKGGDPFGMNDKP